MRVIIIVEPALTDLWALFTLGIFIPKFPFEISLEFRNKNFQCEKKRPLQWLAAQRSRTIQCQAVTGDTDSSTLA